MVYELTVVNGTLRALYNFEGKPNGAFPESNLLFGSRGAFYGTSAGGSVGKGIVYEVKLDGSERIVYDFKGIPDGYRPVVGLVSLDDSDRMYGVTRTEG